MKSLHVFIHPLIHWPVIPKTLWGIFWVLLWTLEYKSQKSNSYPKEVHSQGCKPTMYTGWDTKKIKSVDNPVFSGFNRLFYLPLQIHSPSLFTLLYCERLNTSDYTTGLPGTLASNWIWPMPCTSMRFKGGKRARVLHLLPLLWGCHGLVLHKAKSLVKRYIPHSPHCFLVIFSLSPFFQTYYGN